MSREQRQLVLRKGRLELESCRLPRRPAGYARIRVLLAGICNTDLELQRGYYGFEGVPGHEFVGEVVECDDRRLLGARVVGEINLACGRCEWCLRKLGRHCPVRKVLGIVGHPGAMSEYLTLPERNLHRVPDSVSDEQAVFVEPLAAAAEILDQVRLPKEGSVAVLGDGKLGILVAKWLLHRGASVRHYGRHRSKLALTAADGAEVTVSARRPRAAHDLVIEATGSPQGLADAVRLCRPRGTVVMKSTVHGSVALDTAPVIVDEITLVGSRCGRMEVALRALRRHDFGLEQMISAVLPLERAGEAFELAQQRGVRKVLLRPVP